MIKNVFKVFLSNVVSVSIGLINIFLFPKLLNIDDYATYQTFNLYVSFLGMLILGFNAGLFIKYGGKKKKDIEKGEFKSEIYFLITLQGFFTFLGILLWMITKSNLLLYLSMYLAPLNIVATYKTLFQAWNQFQKFLVLNVTATVLPSFLSLILFFIFRDSNPLLVIMPVIFVNAILSIYLIYKFFQETWKIKRKVIFSQVNFSILKTGFFIMVGSAIFIVLNSIDRFFVKFSYGNKEFALYAFALSMQSVMNVFISAISQPLYIKLTEFDVDNNTHGKNLEIMKQILFGFGSLSGSAYFACSIFISHLLPKYQDSLAIISIIFAIFPALSVITSLYINLYKVTNKVKTYIKKVFVLVICCIILNIFAVEIFDNYLCISIATTICYYIWLWYSGKDFESLRIIRKDWFYLLGFLIFYFTYIKILPPSLGFFVHLISAVLWFSIIYKEAFKFICKYIVLSRKKFIKFN